MRPWFWFIPWFASRYVSRNGLRLLPIRVYITDYSPIPRTQLHGFEFCRSPSWNSVLEALPDSCPCRTPGASRGLCRKRASDPCPDSLVDSNSLLPGSVSPESFLPLIVGILAIKAGSELSFCMASCIEAICPLINANPAWSCMMPGVSPSGNFQQKVGN